MRFFYAVARLMGSLRSRRTFSLMLGAAMFMVPGSGSVLAHDWYPSECCAGYDCEPVPGKDADMPGYYNFLVKNPNTGAIHEYTVPQEMTRPSEDERYHACWPKYAEAPRCFFIPTRGA
jgi:hypothetical protein